MRGKRLSIIVNLAAFAREYRALLTLGYLSTLAQSAYRFANDLRLLQYMHEVEEPFEKNQV